MSVEEMKQEAILHLANLKSEEAVKEILDQLVKLADNENNTLQLANHFTAINEQYGSVLEKLAQ